MPVNDARTGLMRAGLNLIQQALSIYDRDLKLARKRLKALIDG